MSAAPSFQMYRNLLATLIVQRRRRAGLTSTLDVRDWRTGAEANPEAIREAIETFIDVAFGAGTAPRLGPDPYRALLSAEERVVEFLAPRLHWKLYDREDEARIGALAQRCGLSVPELRREVSRSALHAAAGELEREQTVRIGQHWFTDVFGGRKVAVEPWAIAVYRDPVMVLQWYVATACRIAREIVGAAGHMRDVGTDAYDRLERLAYDGLRDDRWTPPTVDLVLEDEERQRLLERLVARLKELVSDLTGLLQRLLTELLDSGLDVDGVAWPNRTARKRLFDRLRADPEVRKIAGCLGIRELAA